MSRRCVGSTRLRASEPTVQWQIESALTSMTLPAAPRRLTIATRESALALWQAEHIRARLAALYPGCEVEPARHHDAGRPGASTSRSPTSAARGCSSRSSRSRWPTAAPTSPSIRSRTCRWTCPTGFALAAICAREDPRDAFVSNHYLDLAGLPGGARVGTSSLRREAQLRERDPLLQVLPLRGNVNTRLRKLDEGRYDAIILAAAGLKRLGFARTDRVAARSRRRACRRPGQGALALECRARPHRRRGRARAARRSRHDARDDRRARVFARAVGQLPHAARRARGVPRMASCGCAASSRAATARR